MNPDDFVSLIPSSLLGRSGAVFYSGRAAFLKPSPLYILGLNPGGCPTDDPNETIGQKLINWPSLPDEWSAYSDDIWKGLPGTHGMQPRVVHLLSRLGLNPRHVPASNVVFVRTRDEASLAAEKQSLLQACWPVHRAVIEQLGVTTILCFGGTAGWWVREALGAHKEVGSFVENNNRRWTSTAHLSPNGLCAITATHPSRADWRNPDSDPTPLVKKMLLRK